ATEPTLRAAAIRAIEEALAAATRAGTLPEVSERVGVEVSRPANAEHGDLATNLAMRLARPMRRAPLEIAKVIAAELTAAVAGDAGATPFASIDVAPPGFINLRLSDAALDAVIGRILAEPAGWGRVAAATPRRINVEFVSANPTGPLTIGNARGAFVGDVLCRILEAGGHGVAREYYFNDSGAQIGKLGATVFALRTGAPVPEDGYHGDYTQALADALPEAILAAALAPGADPAEVVGAWAAGAVRTGIEASLAHLGVHFDVWKSEGSLHTEGWVGRAIERLRAGGHVYEQDGATWFRSTSFGDDKDRVILRSNGEPTYFASDIGYVTEKFSRGFEELIYIWGADHHGTVARVRNAAEAMGYDKEAVRMLLIAWVRFIVDGVEVSMSKRAGTFITLDQLLDEVGVDAARWFFASRGPTSGIDFDIELAKKQSSENPVYYVQYAHARIASILRRAAEAGLEPAPRVGPAIADPAEGLLARQVVRLPEVVEDAAALEESQGITAFATELATAFHAFYRDAKVVDAAESERSRARLALVSAAKISLANALALLGISAPESM
ncbi:MAG TPA: arginine--tRNA ligase, partial [Candidatus Limnocylindrales bacterium]|nr:arginine--tRNA ligase [Candidatus Limnocylindrales bacterium]